MSPPFADGVEGRRGAGARPLGAFVRKRPTRIWLQYPTMPTDRRHRSVIVAGKPLTTPQIARRVYRTRRRLLRFLIGCHLLKASIVSSRNTMTFAPISVRL
jgi:hypothetical protein